MGRVGLFILFFLLAFSVTATLYAPVNERYIATGQNSNWYYIQIHRADNTNSYLGVSKVTRGSIGIADNTEYFGNMWLVPAFRHPVNSQWYLCPIRNIATLNSAQDLGNGWQFTATNQPVTCYQYLNPATTGTANLTLQFSLTTDNNAQTKINVTTTVIGINPTDTGFGFMFFPTNPAKYRYVNISGTVYDLAGADGNVSVDKLFEFLNSNQNPIGQAFDWSDMLDNGNRFARIMTVNSQKALLVGTYGYGASNTITIDPLYSVDYSPNPANLLINGNLTNDADTSFTQQINITTQMSDNLTTTNYEVGDKIIHPSNTLYAVDVAESIYISTNLGVTWTKIVSPFKVSVADSSAIEKSPNGQLYIVVSNREIYNSSNGINWSLTISDYSVTALAPVDMVITHEGNIVIVDGGEDIYVSTNNGSSFTRVNTDFTGGLGGSAMDMNKDINNLLYIITSNEDIFRSSNGGTTWTRIATSIGTSTIADFMTSNKQGNLFALLNGKVVFTSTNGGINWTQINSDFNGGDANNGVLMKSDGDNLFVIDGGEDVWKSSDGISWALQSSNMNGADGSVKGIATSPYWQKPLPKSAISGKWSQIYNSTFTWFLTFVKTTDETNEYRIHAYNSTDNVNPAMSVAQNISGSGRFNINVSSLLNFMTNVKNMTFTQLRLFSNSGSNISEIWLRQELNDTIPPTIQECQSNTTTLLCLQSAHLDCNVTDNLDLSSVFYQINNVNYTPVKTVNHWSLDFDPNVDGNFLFDFQQVFATDIVGNVNQSDPNIQINYSCVFADYINITHTPVVGVDIQSLTNESAIIHWTTTNPADTEISYGTSPTFFPNTIHYHGILVTDHSVSIINLLENTTYFYNITSGVNPYQTLGVFNFTTLAGCTENWVEDPIVCQVNDSYLSTFSDQNACGTYLNVPAQNGTSQFCNYCSEDLVPNLGICQVGDTQSLNYTDNNYFSCCAVTGLPSDCSILTYPYNETTSQFCQYLNSEMGVPSCPAEFDFTIREKEYCVVYIPSNYSNESFKCIANVLDASGRIVQTNPEYRERTTTLIDIGNDPESRQYFTPANSIVTVYLTKKNLLPEQDYYLSIQCSSPQRLLESTHTFQIGYQNFEFVFFRTRWLISNSPYIIGGVIILFLLLGIGWLIYKGVF